MIVGEKICAIKCDEWLCTIEEYEILLAMLRINENWLLMEDILWVFHEYIM